MSKLKESKMDSRSLEKRLSSVRETSEEIQTLSRWCLQHKNHHHSIIQAWSRSLRKAKVPHRLTLFYICNDIVQNARRKKIPDMVQHFATAIKEAAPLVRDEKIRPKIIRIFNIWEERGIYDAKLIAEFTEIVENVGTVNASENEIVLSSFQPVQLVEGIRTVVALEKSTESLRNDLRNQDFSLTDDEINQLRQTVKERGTSRERMEEFEEAVVALECYLASVQKEIEERTQVVTLLEQAEIFYETQRGEAKMVANAYKSFGNRVKTLKTKLLEKIKSLPDPSPVPSPTPDAPSPENSDDEDLSLPDAAQPGVNSFMNSSAFAEFAKDALNSSGNLDSRLSALHRNDESPLKRMPEMSMSAVLEMEIKDVDSSKENMSDDDIVEIPQREFPARDSMEREVARKSASALRESSERRRSSESREFGRMKDFDESRERSEGRDSRDHKSSSRWDVKDNRGLKDLDIRRDNHDMSSSSRRDSQERKDIRDDWEWERDIDHREYSSRERRSSRSSRDSRDSHDTGAGESRDNYRSSSWDHVGSDRDYPHKSRERDFSHTLNSSYDTSLQIPKDLKPMSAAELLDTFGKVFSKSLNSGSSVTSPSPFEPVKAPTTPVVQPPMPDLSRPPPSLSIPLPPSNPPATESPTPFSSTPSGSGSQTPYTPTKPLYQPPPYTPESTNKPSYCPPLPPPPPPPPPPVTTSSGGTVTESLPFPPFDTGTAPTWIPPPPPPPPPPELAENEISSTGADYDTGGRSFGPSWSDYDDESDDRNWGEPPGNEELEALNSDTPSSPPPYEKGFVGSLAPPPLPPSFCGPRSNLREIASEDHRTNLVSIQPNTVDSDYRCYNYRSLSEEPKPAQAPVPSIKSLFSSEMDQDLRIKKPGLKQGRTESGSDMDISNSESEDNMDISDGSGKEDGNNRGGESRKRKLDGDRNKADTKKNLEDQRRNVHSDEDLPGGGPKMKVSDRLQVERVNSIPSKTDEKDVKPITSIVGNSGNISPSEDVDVAERVMSINAKEVESILSQMRRASSLNSANQNVVGSNSCLGVSSNVKVLTNPENDNSQFKDDCDERSESDENEDPDKSSEMLNQNSDETNNGPTNSANNDTSMSLEEKSQSGGGGSSNKNEEHIPTLIAKNGSRGNIEKDFNAPRNVTEGNMIDVIDVMKNLDREFNQQKTRGPRGGPNPRFMNRGRGMPPFGGMGRGERFNSPHNPRGGWGFGGPVFNSPRGRGRGHRGAPPYSPSGRGFRGPNPNRGGRNWYGAENWF
ncbi:uncharacterized protein [Palaemon carinicauda]|uniref:uncharacterized protein n=1 Tax=Palaemon carinicauda TaxID=392227 RepID=UPI0035B6357B